MTSSLAFQWTELDVPEKEDQSPRLWLLEDAWDPSCGTVSSLMAKEKFTLSPDASVHEAARAMNKLDLDHIPVIENNGTLVGLLTFTCLARVVRFGLETLKPGASVKDVMVKSPVTILPQTELKQALDTLRVHRFSFLPVVDQAGLLLGSVSSRDLLRVMSPELEVSLGRA